MWHTKLFHKKITFYLCTTKTTHLCQSLQGEVCHHPYLAVVEEDGVDPPPPDEPGVDQLGHVVPVQVDRRGVHGDQGRDVLVPAVGTLDDIVGPVVIVVTGATLINIFIIRLSLNIFLLIFAPKNVIITTVKQFVKSFFALNK